MKKFLVLFVCLMCLFASASLGDELKKGFKIGTLPKEVTESSFSSQVAPTWKWSVLHPEHTDTDEFKFYDDLTALLMALDAGEIDEIDFPDIVAEYVIAVNPKYEISCVMRLYSPINFVFGFLKNKNEDLCDSFNAALAEMRKDGTLHKLKMKYSEVQGKEVLKTAAFTNFPDAKTVKIAVTGDIPPIDYTAEDGEAAGFNVEVLSEIGRRLKINIQLLNVNSNSRSAALTSGRADGVFWYMKENGNEIFDIPDEIITSDPYYSFNTFLQIRKK